MPNISEKRPSLLGCGGGGVPLLDQAADHTQGVVDGALGLLNDQLVGASYHDAHRLPWATAASDLHPEQHHLMLIHPGATPPDVNTIHHVDTKQELLHLMLIQYTKELNQLVNKRHGRQFILEESCLNSPSGR